MAEIKLKPIYIDGEDIGVPGSDTYIEYWEKRYNEAGSRDEYKELWDLEFNTIQSAYQKDVTNAAGDGPFDYNTTHAYGVLKEKTGYSYLGNWKNGRRDGKGVENYESGSIYTGHLKNGKRSGHGTMKYSNGEVAIGNWLNGRLSDAKKRLIPKD